MKIPAQPKVPQPTLPNTKKSGGEKAIPTKNLPGNTAPATLRAMRALGYGPSPKLPGELKVEKGMREMTPGNPAQSTGGNPGHFGKKARTQIWPT